ncbi:23S rRNA (pseudouridine(1915)-N(3))-methyltransferase RlmH [Helicobacter cholecystus]|uniref:Ribosomal RNA large subunit methyltransferase H n=1 Tax=Helicobacter cholecystus TaxID=45498 RepID=A0A3D8IZX9_9HELI|nr:23S rRNA (pseudouridine(1915)-N(3))-methyltransferase RlmH [Helicobacter cholecystus]RDU70164.1 23S rRNA (pseudouridine(1915)-N(3))-methyltransferase RlmH [Helicobacter cholecystus]VEJ24656.1 rRNA large subunit methyltransferase [Helicobacter cholecystus]
MKINVFSIVKNDPYQSLYNEFIKQCRGLGANLNLKNIFNHQIAKAQKNLSKEAQSSYTQAFKPYLTSWSFSLHPQGKILDSFKFAKLFEGRLEVNFFIGGAYGFDEEFLSLTQPISLSPLTFSHKIVKIILCEQIYRALSINANHPYHK